MDIKKHIGRNIRQVRAQLKMTQAQLGRALAVSPQTVSSWEIGDSGISVEAAVRLSELAGISLDWLFKGELKADYTEVDGGLTPEELQFIRAFRSVSRSDQQAFIRLAESISNTK